MVICPRFCIETATIRKRHPTLDRILTNFWWNFLIITVIICNWLCSSSSRSSSWSCTFFIRRLLLRSNHFQSTILNIFKINIFLKNALSIFMYILLHLSLPNLFTDYHYLPNRIHQDHFQLHLESLSLRELDQIIFS